MRKPTPTESVFLAGTLATAILATAEVVPDVMQELKEDAIQARELKNKSSGTSAADAFTTGVIVGMAAGVAMTAKVISDKLNNP